MMIYKIPDSLKTYPYPPDIRRSVSEHTKPIEIGNYFF